MDFVLIYSYVNQEYHLVPVTRGGIGEDTDLEVLYEFHESELVIANRILQNLRLERARCNNGVSEVSLQLAWESQI